MKRKYKRRTSRFGIFFVFLTAVTIAGVFFIPWAMKPDNFRNEKNKINSWLNGIFFQDFYNAKSLILVDLSNDNIFISKRENEQQLPASLAKLFVIEYAATLADLDSIVPANYEAIQLTKYRFATLPCMRNGSFTPLTSIFKTKKLNRVIKWQEKR